MARNTDRGGKHIREVPKTGIDDDVDSLFKLPLTEFTDSRNALSARLKKAGRADDAAVIKTLAKPSVSAWAVNQIYWNNRETFDELIEVGEQLRDLQSSGISGKVTQMRASLDARRDVLTQLSDLASSLLQEAGHNPSQDTLRRVTTTLEALSSFGSRDDGPTPGRLSSDVDPPGFESLTSFIPGSFATESSKRESPAKKTEIVATKARPHLKLVEDAKKQRERDETRHANIAVAKLALQSAKKALTDARGAVQTLESQHKKSSAEAKQAEKARRDAEERLRKLSAAAEDAVESARRTAEEFAAATKSLDDAKRALERATKELESLLRD
jgi:DNA repair exonuclease SbcCD ATPase subunit